MVFEHHDRKAHESIWCWLVIISPSTVCAHKESCNHRRYRYRSPRHLQLSLSLNTWIHPSCPHQHQMPCSCALIPAGWALELHTFTCYSLTSNKHMAMHGLLCYPEPHPSLYEELGSWEGRYPYIKNNCFSYENWRFIHTALRVGSLCALY